jgi:hypothetical protein
MSPAYEARPRRYQPVPEDVTGILVLLACAMLAFCWYVAVSRLHLRNRQCLEIFMDFAILFFGGGLVVAQLARRRQKREETGRIRPYWYRVPRTVRLCARRI